MSSNADINAFVQKNFIIPQELKYDLVYLQRTFISHIRVHQMVYDVFHGQRNPEFQRRRQICQELEAELYEINAEQQFNLVKLRQLCMDFLGSLHGVNYQEYLAAVRQSIADQLMPMVYSVQEVPWPIRVTPRLTEAELIERYFQLPVDESAVPTESATDVALQPTLQISGCSAGQTRVVFKREATNSPSVSGCTSGSGTPEAASGSGASVASQAARSNTKATSRGGVSLLKPASRRTQTAVEPHPLVPEVVLTEGEYTAEALAEIMAPPLKDSETAAPGTVISTNVRRSRMNLRQALKRAQEAVMGPAPEPHSKSSGDLKQKALVAASTTVTNTVVTQMSKISDTNAAASSSGVSAMNMQTRKKAASSVVVAEAAAAGAVGAGATRGRKRRGSNNPNNGNGPSEAASTCSNSAPNGSAVDDLLQAPAPKIPRTSSDEYSEEYSDEDIQGAQVPMYPEYAIGRKVLPSDFTQAGFLWQFKLCTPEDSVRLAERKKIPRRCVGESNRAMYLHVRAGLVKKAAARHIAKRPRTYRHRDAKKTTTVCRGRKSSRHPNSGSSTSRSTSGSANERPCCNECRKEHPVEGLKKCSNCEGHFHQSCHRVEQVSSSHTGCEMADPLRPTQRKSNRIRNIKKLCPSCERRMSGKAKAKEELNRSLYQSVQELERTLAREKDRHISLRRAGQRCTLEVHNFLNMVSSLARETTVDSGTGTPFSASSPSEDTSTEGGSCSEGSLMEMEMEVDVEESMDEGEESRASDTD